MLLVILSSTMFTSRATIAGLRAALLGLLILSCVGYAVDKPLPQGTSLLGQDALSALKPAGKEAASAQLRIVPVTGQPFAKALQVTTTVKPAVPWEMQLGVRVPAAIAKGDVLLASFWSRTVQSRAETGEGQVDVVFELGHDPWRKSVERSASFGAPWTRINIAFAAGEAYAAGEGQFLLRVGYDPQTIEIADLALVNYGKQVQLRDLPTTGVTYPGRAADAPWRKAAAERIERIRKADLAVQVTDKDGKPVAGAEVAAHMKHHAFGFGSAVVARAILDQSPDSEKYRDIIKRSFSRVVFENDLKWQSWNKQQVPPALKWLRDAGIQVRGHNLIWPSWRYAPGDLKALRDDPAALAKRITDHITEIVSANRGQLCDWDVINEVYSNHDVVDILGKSAMVDWFRAARAADPQVTLYINDYSILSGGGMDTAHQDAYEQTIRYLIDQKAPIGGIGLQSHFGARLTAPDKLLAILDRFGATGMRLQSTEFDIDIEDEQAQADYTRDFLTMLFSHPAVDGIVMWGFWEGRHWKPRAALWRKDWTIKPNGQAWVDLVTKQWWTDAAGKTDASGKYAVRGFMGEYEVEVKVGGKTKTAKVPLGKAGEVVRVVLD